MEAIHREISKNIKKYRKEKALSQEQLAEKADLSRNYISLVETNKEKVGMSAFIKIKMALNVSASELFGDWNDAKELDS